MGSVPRAYPGGGECSAVNELASWAPLPTKSSKQTKEAQTKGAQTKKAQAPVASKPPRRPSISYTEEIGARLSQGLAEGLSLRKLCAQPGMPTEYTVRCWVATPDHPVIPHYVAGRDLGYRKMADDILAIADGDPEDDSLSKVNRAKLQVHTRMWLLARALPKVYGDRVLQEVTGADGAPLVPEGDTRGLALAVLNIMHDAARGQRDAGGEVIEASTSATASKMLMGMRSIVGLPASGAGADAEAPKEDTGVKVCEQALSDRDGSS